MALRHPALKGYYFGYGSAVYRIGNFLPYFGRWLVAVALARGHHRRDLFWTPDRRLAV